MLKCVSGRGFAPDPAGELTTLPVPPSRMGRGILHTHTLPNSALLRLDSRALGAPLGAFGASVLGRETLPAQIFPLEPPLTGYVDQCNNAFYFRFTLYLYIWRKINEYKK